MLGSIAFPILVGTGRGPPTSVHRTETLPVAGPDGSITSVYVPSDGSIVVGRPKLEAEEVTELITVVPFVLRRLTVMGPKLLLLNSVFNWKPPFPVNVSLAFWPTARLPVSGICAAVPTVRLAV